MNLLHELQTNPTARLVVIILSALNIIGYLVIGNTQFVLYFTLVALIVRMFSTNLVLVLGVPLLFVNMMASGLKEGITSSQKKIDNIVEREKLKSFNVIFPLEGFVGADMHEAYGSPLALERKDPLVAKQFQVLESSKRSVEPFAAMGASMKQWMPFQM